jgi:hypothetical protein
VFQIVLVGRPPLLEALNARALGDLRARITATVETTALSAGEVSDFLTERLEAVEAAVPDVLLPPITMAAIAHHSRGLIGLASALARAGLERAAETGTTTVSVEMIDEIASLYGSPAESADSRSKHPTARAFALGAVAALVVLALVVAAAEVRLLGSGGRRIRADVESLSSLAGFGQVATPPKPAASSTPTRAPAPAVAATPLADGGQSRKTDELPALLLLAGGPTGKEAAPMSPRDAQLKSPREAFLGLPKASVEAAPRPYSVEIKPPQRPEPATGRPRPQRRADPDRTRGPRRTSKVRPARAKP